MAETRFAERRGWTVTIDEWYTKMEAVATEVDCDGDAGRGPPARLGDFA